MTKLVVIEMWNVLRDERKQKLCERFIPNRNYTTLTIREIEKILYKLGIK